MEATDLTADLTERLQQRHPDVPADEVEQAVRDAVARFEKASVQNFVALLAERVARERLQNHAR